MSGEDIGASIDLQAWVGRGERREDVAWPGPLAEVMAALDRPPPRLAPGEPIAAGWHWLFFPDHVARARLAADGLPPRGAFMPPLPLLPRQMFGGARVRFLAPIRIGDALVSQRRIVAITAKHGRQGPLVVVTVEDTISAAGRAAVIEQQDLVYRAAAATDAGPAAAAPVDAARFTVTRQAALDAVTLFRVSAAMFMAHRIHWDRAWATGVEGYPGLLVHGPLTATLLLDLAVEAAGRPPTHFAYRALAPLFDTTPFTLAAAPTPEGFAVTALAPDGTAATTGTVGFAG